MYYITVATFLTFETYIQLPVSRLVYLVLLRVAGFFKM